MENYDKVRKRFLSELDNIALTLIQKFGLKFSQEQKHLSDPLLRWMDFRMRYLDPLPRRLFLSTAFPKTLNDDVKQAWEYMQDLIQRGMDINPYQSKRLIRHNDVSGNKRPDRTDLLWADWRIVHLHLTLSPVQEDAFFSERSDWVLLGIIEEDIFLAIDIRRHDEQGLFADINLLEITLKSWPDFMKRFEMIGIPPSAEPFTMENYARLRKAGVMSMITLNGKCYMPPGMGLTTASTALRSGHASDYVVHHAGEVSKMVTDPSGQFQEKLNEHGIQEGDFELCLTPRGISIYEKNLSMAWVSSSNDRIIRNDSLSRLTYLLTPDWVLGKLNEPSM